MPRKSKKKSKKKRTKILNMLRKANTVLKRLERELRL